ncbi:MAG: hypothetical protein QXS54_00375 [Candidatus Methanomethylicaceae archaeon]
MDNYGDLQNAIIVILTFLIMQVVKFTKEKVPFLSRLDPSMVKIAFSILSVAIGSAIGAASGDGVSQGAMAGLGAIGVNEIMKKLGLSSKVSGN